MDYTQATSRCWLEVDLNAIEWNYDSARRICGEGVQLIPVLKANAYGLGAAKLSQVLSAKGATLFAVATLEEAFELGNACGRDVLVLGMIPEGSMEAAVRKGVITTAYSLDVARALDSAAARVGVPARVHIKLDTGMHRLGLEPGEAVQAIQAIYQLPNLRVEGLFTHLALRTVEADAAQMACFRAVRDALAAAGIDCGLVHAADSIGMVRYPNYRLDAVRPGAWLYGMVPSRFDNSKGDCKMTLRLMTRVVQLHRAGAGEYVGYDETHPLKRDSVIATLSAGYADGYPRMNSTGEVEIRGHRAPIAGLSCMDQMFADVTDIPDVRPGDPVTLIGGAIDIAEVAAWSGTNRNDLLSRIGRRVPRVYLRAGIVEEIGK